MQGTINNTTFAQDKVAITLTLPNPKVILSRFLSRTGYLLSEMYEPMHNAGMNFSSSARRASRVPHFRFPQFNRNNKRKLIQVLLPIGGIVLVVVLIAGIISLLPDSKTTQATTTTTQTAVPAIATKEINKTVKFPLKDEKGKELGKFSYTIQNAQLQKQIIVQGRSATAIPGRVFLIFNLKINNELDKSMQLNSRDYIRITVEGANGEQLAADIHNDPVEVQAISTKYTRLGVAIDEAAARKPITIRIGEIGGKKESFPVTFNY